ncbi:MAG: hypothetical protein M3R61_00095 [Chloroflexota bacterium]|nr:hypothetical protein [Chloroflexota bacterium]
MRHTAPGQRRTARVGRLVDRLPILWSGAMACALILAVFWLLGLVVVLALCKAAKRGDRH